MKHLFFSFAFLFAANLSFIQDAKAFEISANHNHPINSFLEGSTTYGIYAGINIVTIGVAISVFTTFGQTAGLALYLSVVALGSVGGGSYVYYVDYGNPTSNDKNIEMINNQLQSLQHDAEEYLIDRYISSSYQEFLDHFYAQEGSEKISKTQISSLLLGINSVKSVEMIEGAE